MTSNDDLFDDAREGYVKQEDLENRLLLIYPTGVTGQREGESGPYDWAETNTVILDGETTDMIDEVPGLVELFQFTGANVFNTLKLQIKRGKPSLGRLITSEPSKRGRSRPWKLQAPTDADKVLARKYLAANPAPDAFNGTSTDSPY